MEKIISEKLSRENNLKKIDQDDHEVTKMDVYKLANEIGCILSDSCNGCSCKC